MIIYPIIILILLLIAFVIFWRRSYFVEKQGIPEEVESSIAERVDSNKIPAWFGMKKKTNLEPEVTIEKETDPNIIKADELFSKKQFISAEKWYLEAARNNPKNSKIYSRLGIIYIEQKNYKDAIDSLEEAVKLDSSVASRFFNLSFAQNNEGDKKQAFLNAKKAIRLEPSSKKYRKWMEQLRKKSY